MRPLGDVLQELQGKVIKAAEKLQAELLDSAEQPAAVQNDLAAGTADLGGEARLKYRLKGQCRLAKKGQGRLVKKRR